MVVVSIHQPPYLPWFGLIDKIARSDLFVVLDTVQYNKRAFQHRTLYSTAEGGKYLSLSVRGKGAQTEGLKIADVELADASIPRKHFETLRHRYGRRPGWASIEARLASILLDAPARLVELNVALLLLTLEAFRISPRVVMASSLKGEGAKSELMLSLTNACGGTVYLSGSGADAYMDEDLFAARGVGVWKQSFKHPTFQQSHSGDFVPGCFALEWIIEEPDSAAEQFHRHLERTGVTPPRCIDAAGPVSGRACA